MSHKDVKPDWYAVSFNDTKDWNIAAADKKYIKEIYSVYFFDKNKHVYLAEITPSYHLEFGYNDIIFTAKGNDNDSKRDELHENYIYGFGVDNEDTYMHVGRLDAYMKKNKKRVHHYGKTDEDAEDGGSEEVREYLQGNPPL